MIEDAIFNVDEVTEVNEAIISVDKKTRKATISYEAITDEETIRGEVLLSV